MAELRFFGSEAIINGDTLTRYGQVVEMETEAADKLIAASPPALLLPERLWDEIGITPAELADFPSTSVHGSASAEFREKTKAVRMAFHNYRADLIDPPKAAAVTDLHPDISDRGENGEPEA